MLPFFTDYLDRLHALQQNIEQTLEGLPQDAIDWSPGAEMNSLGVLAAHVAGSLIYWVGDTLHRGATQRIREQEFHTHGADAAALKARLAAAIADVHATLAGLTEADLATSRSSPSDGRQITVAWGLLHAITHMAVHVGHMQLVRQLWEQTVAKHNGEQSA